MKKTVALVVAGIVVLNMVLLALQKIHPLTFWLVVGLSALIAFVILPKIK